MKLISKISTIAITGIYISAMMAGTVFADVQATANDNRVNVRSSASSTAEIIGVINNGKEVTVSKRDNDWYRVSYDNLQTGYVSIEFIDMPVVLAQVNADNINIREYPSSGGKVVAAVKKGDKVSVTGFNGAWYQIKRTNGDTAYITSEYVTGENLDLVKPVEVEIPSNIVENTYAIVNGNNLNVRATPSTSGEKITSLSNGTIVDVVEAGSEWIKIKTDSGVVGYVNRSYVTLRSGEATSRSLTSSRAQQVIDYSKQFLGTPYSWGGTNLSKGVDCSGFVYSVYKNFGITLNRSSSAMAANGVAVSKDQLVAGDLVLFDTSGPNNGAISHVGIYIGNGEYIHSSSGKAYSVIISNLYDDYSARTYVTARRVLR